jgi:RHS repeat-associated protein
MKYNNSQILCSGSECVQDEERYFTSYGFTGEPGDANGLVYLRNRYYNPALGTFISMDAFGGNPNDPMSLNRYAYVEGNPVNKTDPSGLCVDDACKTAAELLEAAHPNVYIYWPGKIDTASGVFTYPTPTVTPTDMLTSTPTNTPMPTLAACPTQTPTPPATPTGLAYESTGALYNPKEWQTDEVNVVKEALDIYVSGRGTQMFKVVYLRVPSLPRGAGGLTVGDYNAGFHPQSTSINVLLSDAWSSLLQNTQYGKWLVVHETNHAFLWLIRGDLDAQNAEYGVRTVDEFVIDRLDPSVFPTNYAASNFDTGTEYVVEAMTAMIWDRTGESRPSVGPHVYNNSPRDIFNREGVDMDTWIRQVLLPSFIP